MADHTPGPWGKPYLDTLPNGLHAFRIDSTQEAGVDVIALLYVGDEEITAIQHANARLIAKAPQMEDMLREIRAEIENGDVSPRTVQGIDRLLRSLR